MLGTLAVGSERKGCMLVVFTLKSPVQYSHIFSPYILTGNIFYCHLIIDPKQMKLFENNLKYFGTWS
jgi:hypothetical protein